MKNHSSKAILIRRKNDKKKFIVLFIVMLLLSIFSTLSMAQESELEKNIFKKDSLFWVTYNTCHLEGMKTFLAEDLEFYHDKGGITLGQDDLITSMAEGLCQGGENSIRREAVPGTVKVFPLMDNGEVYGAIITGEHLFFPNPGDKKKADGIADFSNLWLLKDGNWKMHRVLSYNHRAAPYHSGKLGIKLSAEILKSYEGEYFTSTNQMIKIIPSEDHLNVDAMGKQFIFYPESEIRFFCKERDLSILFEKQKALSLKFFEADKEVETATHK